MQAARFVRSRQTLRSRRPTRSIADEPLSSVCSVKQAKCLSDLELLTRYGKSLMLAVRSGFSVPSSSLQFASNRNGTEIKTTKVSVVKRRLEDEPVLMYGFVVTLSSWRSTPGDPVAQSVIRLDPTAADFVSHFTTVHAIANYLSPSRKSLAQVRTTGEQRVQEIESTKTSETSRQRIRGSDAAPSKEQSKLQVLTAQIIGRDPSVGRSRSLTEVV